TPEREHHDTTALATTATAPGPAAARHVATRTTAATCSAPTSRTAARGATAAANPCSAQPFGRPTAPAITGARATGRSPAEAQGAPGRHRRRGGHQPRGAGGRLHRAHHPFVHQRGFGLH